MKQVNIGTAQNVDIEYPLAGPGERITASMIDYVFIILYYIGMVYILVFLYENFFEKYYFYIILLQLPVIVYDLFFETVFNGQSPGKKIMRIKVVMLDGTQPSIGSYFLRWILRFIDLGFSGGTVALSVMLINGKGQRLGDIAAGTTVVSLKSRAALKDTILIEIDSTYTARYPDAVKLDDTAAAVIKEALDFYRRNKKNRSAAAAIEKTKTVIEQKLQITAPADAEIFLETVIKDYNYLNGKV